MSIFDDMDPNGQNDDAIGCGFVIVAVVLILIVIALVRYL